MESKDSRVLSRNQLTFLVTLTKKPSHRDSLLEAQSATESPRLQKSMKPIYSSSPCEYKQIRWRPIQGIEWSKDKRQST